MMVGATRHFEASFSTVEWLLDERQDDLTDEEIEALRTYHDVLCRVSRQEWSVEPPQLPVEAGDGGP